MHRSGELKVSIEIIVSFLSMGSFCISFECLPLKSASRAECMVRISEN
jgi:hypothetical protein